MKTKRNQLTNYIGIVFTFNILLLLSASQSFGQQTYTYCKPNGTLVTDAAIVEEMSKDQINSTTQDFINANPHFEVLAPASSRYNCFGYAFCMTEGSDTVVLGMGGTLNAVNAFSLDGSSVGYSFVEVSENQNPDKAILVAGDCKTRSSIPSSPHAAITCSDPTKLISKSGWNPVFKHPKNANIGELEVGTVDCYRYYKRNYSINLNGPNSVSGNAAFSVAYTKATFSQVSWKAEPANIFLSANGNGQTANLTVRTGVTSLPSSGSITFYLGHGCDNKYRVTKTFTILPCPTFNFTNRTVTTNTVVTNCGDINVQNVKVSNTAKLILGSSHQIIINDGFEVESTAQFETK